MAAPEIGLYPHGACHTKTAQTRPFRNLAAVMHGDGAIGEPAEEPNIVIDDARERRYRGSRRSRQHVTADW